MATDKKSKDLQFYYYRYQIVPTSNSIQTTIDDYEIKDYEDLVSKKNKIFRDVVNSKSILMQGRSADYIYKVLSVEHNYFLLRIARKKDINIDKEDFSEETIVSYPNVLILIDNRPSVQQLIIQMNYRAFESTEVVANILEKNFNRYLHQYQLSFYLRPITEKQEFWELTKKYEDRITQVAFEIIKPNMANISKNLSEDLKSLQKDTNSHKTKIELNSTEDSRLENLNEKNGELAGLVHYANEGGGEISVKVKGIRKKIHTNKQVITESIDEITIKGVDPKKMLDILKAALV